MICVELRAQKLRNVYMQFAIYYRSLARKGPWVVHLTLGSNRGWTDIAGINTGHHTNAQSSTMHDIVG